MSWLRVLSASCQAERSKCLGSSYERGYDVLGTYPHTRKQANIGKAHVALRQLRSVRPSRENTLAEKMTWNTLSIIYYIEQSCIRGSRY